MNTINKRYIWGFFIILIVVMAGTYLMNTTQTNPNKKPGMINSPIEEAKAGSYYTVRDQSGLTILQTGVKMHVDDRYIDTKNVEYIIIKVDGQNAVAEVLTHSEVTPPVQSSTSQQPLSAWNPAVPAQTITNAHIVIYHSHTDESFTPTSGTPSEPGQGDIYKVGSTLTNALEKAGISVTHSFEKHDPHDINAYHRSRRTLTNLLKEQPDAAFDIHRDSAPTKAYLTNVNGIETSRVMIVVGRSNPRQKTTLDFAKRIKAEVDKLYPDLMRGIYIGKGNYNQDLYPTALLFEIGTESISLDLPEQSARLLADAIIQVIANK